MDFIELLRLAVKRNVSDIQLLAGYPPSLRIDGRLITIDSSPLTPEDTREIFNEMTNDEQKETFQKELELDFSFSFQGGVRFRANAARQKGSVSLVIRTIRSNIPSIEDLGLPSVCQELITKSNGLVLLTGPTGCGKSTTLASMIQYLNQHHSRRVITIEDPIEYEYKSDKCVISQREVGFDTHTFAAALKRVLRQDPDVILVGEMRDLETAAAALTIAETGHLVLTTGHAPSAPLSIERIIDLFPAHQQNLALGRLSAVLQGVLCQRLLPKADGAGRVPAVEIMLATSAVRNLIRENKTYQLQNVIRTSSQQGMRCMDEALAGLYLKKLISKKELFDNCNDENEVARLIGEPRVGALPGAKLVGESPRQQRTATTPVPAKG